MPKEKPTEHFVYREWGPLPRPEPELVDQPPAQQKLTVRRDRKGRGGKTVTVIAGFALTAASLESLAKQLKSQCGSGGTAKEDSIEIQGDHRDKVAMILQELGYKVKLAGG